MNLKKALTIFCFTSFWMGSPSVTYGQDLPNMIVILCDDLGYGDLACYGSTLHRTPNIDQLAKEGMRFTDFYSTAPFCSPARASLLTGCYPMRIDMGTDEDGYCVIFPGSPKGLGLDEQTIPEMLKEKDYASACIGKWHLGDQEEFLPIHHGFDYYFGIPYSNDTGDEFENKYDHPVFHGLPPTPLLRNDEVIEAPVDQNTITKRYTEEALSFIEKNRDNPFFLFLSHTMPHNPVHSSKKFRGKSANGGYGDAVEEIDWSTGEIMKLLDRLDIDENTIVFFTSDNGASWRFGGSNKPFSGFKGSTKEGGIRVPFIARWPIKITPGAESGQLASLIDYLPTLAAAAGIDIDKKRIDGMDLTPVLTGEEESIDRTYYYYLRDELKAVRMGDFKLSLDIEDPVISCFESNQKFEQGGLYNLAEDPGETKDIRSEYPDLFQLLQCKAELGKYKYGNRDIEGVLSRKASYVEHPDFLIKK